MHHYWFASLNKTQDNEGSNDKRENQESQDAIEMEVEGKGRDADEEHRIPQLRFGLGDGFDFNPNVVNGPEYPSEQNMDVQSELTPPTTNQPNGTEIETNANEEAAKEHQPPQIQFGLGDGFDFNPNVEKGPEYPPEQDVDVESKRPSKANQPNGTSHPLSISPTESPITEKTSNDPMEIDHATPPYTTEQPKDVSDEDQEGAQSPTVPLVQEPNYTSPAHSGPSRNLRPRKRKGSNEDQEGANQPGTAVPKAKEPNPTIDPISGPSRNLRPRKRKGSDEQQQENAQPVTPPRQKQPSPSRNPQRHSSPSSNLRPRRGAKKPQPQVHWTTDDSDSDVDIDDPKDQDYLEPARKKAKKGPGKLSGGWPQPAQRKRSRSAEPDSVADDDSDAQDTLPKKRSRSSEVSPEDDAQHTLTKKRARLEDDKKDNNAPKFKPKRKRNASREEDALEDDAGEEISTKKVRITNAEDKEDSDAGWETMSEDSRGDTTVVEARVALAGPLSKWVDFIRKSPEDIKDYVSGWLVT